MKLSLFLLLAAPVAYGATWIPLNPTNNSTFFNADIIFENDGTPTTNNSIGSRYLFEQGLNGATPGLAVGGAYTYATTGASFQLQPYSGNNVRRTTDMGELGRATALFSPGNYDTIAIAAAVGNQNAGGRLTWTVTYVGGTTTIATFDVEDWGNTSHTNELFNVARATSNTIQDPVTNPGTYWSAYVYEIDTDATKQIESISFVTAATGRLINVAPGQPGYQPPTIPDPDNPTGPNITNPAFPAPQIPSTNAGDVHIFGFSGQVIPEPSSVALLGSALSLSFLRRRRN